MCTVTWERQVDGYVLLCNRDERDSRRAASGPRIAELRQTSFIAPVDGDHGGSWIGVNEFGLALCLLNRYGDPNVESQQDYTSRGLLLTDLLDCRLARNVTTRLAGIPLQCYRPFSLLVLSITEPACLVEWNGHALEINTNVEDRVPLTSTSLNEPEIAIGRRRQFEQLKTGVAEVTPELLYQFHRSHVPEQGAYSVCMHRDGAATVSLSVVTVNKESVELAYRPGPPCEDAAAEVVSLTRAGGISPGNEVSTETR